MKLKDQIFERFNASDQSLSTKRDYWDSYEKLFHNQLADNISLDSPNQVFDPKLSTLILEREARVMAQLATGKVKAISKNDEGASKLMNLTLDKYVIPNANSQFDFLTKCRMVDRYSNIYGNFFVMVDWVVRADGYRGPDMWLLPIRDVFPQVGAISLDDSDHIIIRSWRPLSFFENLKKQDGYKNVGDIVALLKEKTGSKGSRDDKYKSQRESHDFPNADPAKKSGYFQILSQYEGDRWVDMCLDAEELDDRAIFRDMGNPHDNGELPVVNKFSIPLLDDFLGMGDMERGAPQQNTLNSVWNLYLSAAKMSIFPPTLINKDNIADNNSIKFSWAAKWLMRNSPGSAGTTGAKALEIAPQGLSTFQAVYGIITSSLMNQFGTTTTQTTQDTDPGFGKTPQALQMQAARENAKDSVDRFYMEQFLTKVNKKFVNLISKKRTGAIQFRMFEDEIHELVQQYPDMQEMYDEKTGKVTIDKSKMGSLVYDYEIVSGSTYAVDQKQQQQNLMGLLNTVLNPQAFQIIQTSLQNEQKELMVGELFTRIMSNSGITDWDKIIVDRKNNPQAGLDQQGQQFAAAQQDMMNQQGLDQQMKTFQQALMQAGGVNGVPSEPTQPMHLDQNQLMNGGMNEAGNQA